MSKLKIIIAGGRDFNDYKTLKTVVKDRLVGLVFKGFEIVSGGAPGADRLGERFAKRYNIKLTIMKADWDLQGSSAGCIRNVEMADYGDELIAFWDGKSKRTKHMIDTAKKKGLTVSVFSY